MIDVTESNTPDTLRFLQFRERTSYTEDSKSNCERMEV
jgi:hypothetical protein